MKLTTSSAVPVYTIAGEGTARPLPEWLARKRRRSLKKDSEYANRIELLQDFEFEEASQCVRVSEDGEWVLSTGTYKPQMHAHYLPHLSLSYARHTDALNQTFILLSSDYSKSLHLQADRSLQFHTPGGLHYTTRIPRYGRDLKYNSRSAEALIPAVGVNSNGLGEVYRLNLEVGRFMKGYEVDVGGDDFESMGGGALQGGIRTGSVNCATIAEESHGLLAFGTSLGTVEFWDARSRARVSVLGPPTSVSMLDTGQEELRPEMTALAFHPSGLRLATGASNGFVHTYDLRSPVPLLRKDQGYDFPIQTLQYLNPSSSSSSSISSDKLLSSDRKSIKLFDSLNGDLWTSIEPAVDLNHVAWVPDSGMLLTANEGRQQHAFLIPQLGPAPKWCSFLDNLVEEMADDQSADPQAWSSNTNNGMGEVYDNFKFVDQKELQALNLDHLVGSSTNVLRPYMHGHFVPQRLYEQARLLANPDLALDQRRKTIQEKIDKERESRIRGSKKVDVKVNRKLAEKLAAREDANERRKAQRLLRKQKQNDEREEDEEELPTAAPSMEAASSEKQPKKATTDLMDDSRFKSLFEDEDFEIDETSREFQMHNPSTAAVAGTSGESKPRRLTAAEEEGLDEDRHSSSDEDDDDSNGEDSRPPQRERKQAEDEDRTKGRIGSVNYKKSGHQPQNPWSGKDQRKNTGPRMHVSSSSRSGQKALADRRSQSFGDLAAGHRSRSSGGQGSRAANGGVVGEKSVSFTPAKAPKRNQIGNDGDMDGGAKRGRAHDRFKERRSASGNVFRRM